MAIDLSRKRIIMIHGLASKPPADKLHEMWRSCVVENIRVGDKTLAKHLDLQLKEPLDTFVSAYWANRTPHHIEDDSKYVGKLKTRVKAVIDERKKTKGKFHVGTGKKIGAFFKGRSLDVVNILGGALRIKDDVMKNFLRETELYDEDQYIADRMREPLEEALRKAWEEGCDIALISHSMGTFIAYDVLWRFSHRNVKGFRKYRRRRVQMFVTMGSPLGDSVIRDMLFARFHKHIPVRQFPSNIDFWHNYACLGDVVSHQHNFNASFFESMRKEGLFPRNPRHRAIDYTNLHNPFKVVSHSGNKGREKANPHKSFGYLVQPRLGSWITDFLRDRLVY